MRSIMIFGSPFLIATFLVGAKAITSTSCYDKGDLIECYQVVEPVNITHIAEKGIQAGGSSQRQIGGPDCTDPEGDVVEGTLQCTMKILVRASYAEVMSYSSRMTVFHSF
ncbi:hypothetical protein IW261DRAFT_1612797 [Armillaria novae-zelandiae]|uniref:Uncharacterized protein n=1 Tax=Armillaria novae-zelandiae TaxID=153914 RepID=A0AA39NEJ9_9AGAR|nr:hypothetical protein IW261DRAFT_1525031 [Armillaria novae-zelandiae]KAK0468683.1 hypothetical protein IW261DRAFT_1612797 [Armillaria novae-zelandiae]